MKIIQPSIEILKNGIREIPFTQYLRPCGRKKEISIERPTEVCEKAMEIINAGYSFEIEVLTTGRVNMTISNDEDDHDMEIVDNGFNVPVAVDRMINRFYKTLKESRQ